MCDENSHLRGYDIRRGEMWNQNYGKNEIFYDEFMISFLS